MSKKPRLPRVGLPLTMWNVVAGVARQYLPVITLPIAIVIGFIGYNAETILSSKSTPAREMTVAEEREERQLKKLLDGTNESDSKEQTRYSAKIPKTVLDRNEFRKSFGEGHYEQKDTKPSS